MKFKKIITKIELKKILMLTSLLAIALSLVACQNAFTGNVVKQLVQTPTPSTTQQLDQSSIPTITITDIPDTAKTGDEINVKWWIYSVTTGKAYETALLYGFESHPNTANTFGTKMTADKAGYIHMSQDYINSLAPLDVPGYYFAKFTAPTNGTTIYVRAYALINGNNYWSDEHSIRILSNEKIITPEQELMAKQAQIDEE